MLIILVEIKANKIIEVSDYVAQVLNAYRDVMPLEFLKTLPPCRHVDHKIESKYGKRH